jgi:class 3 adenylate cyclase
MRQDDLEDVMFAPRSHNIFTLFVLLLVALVTALIGGIGYVRYADFRRNQEEISRRAVAQGASEISLAIRNIRHQTRVFSKERTKLIRQLQREPSNATLYEELREGVEEYFPNYFAITIADSVGTTVLSNFDQLVGKGCRRDIREFARNLDNHKVYIHSSPQQKPYHFDVMIPWGPPDSDHGVFFVSFQASLLTRVLKNTQPYRHNLMLALKNGGYLIEVTAKGPRDVLPRKPKLSQEEVSEIQNQALVAGTRWVLLDLPDLDLFATKRQQVINHATLVQVGFMTVAGFLLWVVRREEKRRTRAEHELAEWSRTLEQRVQEEVAQVERLGRLKRFFSPQLAELIVEGGTADPLKTHRSQVTVVFLDIRGFTAFAEKVEPEEVMSVLREYHAEMGKLIQEHEGTLERFTGDGMMIFFNDPVPVPNPAERAIRMAVAMREQVRQLSTVWRKSDYDLAFGIGIAQGYATIGAIGFEGRWDYGAIGTVTNLAARLCGEAKAGQILVSRRLAVTMEELVEGEFVGDLVLKGFHRPVSAFNVVRLKEN